MPDLTRPDSCYETWQDRDRKRREFWYAHHYFPEDVPVSDENVYPREFAGIADAETRQLQAANTVLAQANTALEAALEAERAKVAALQTAIMRALPYVRDANVRGMLRPALEATS